MRFLTLTALAALAASPAEAQNRFFSMPSRVEMFAHAALDTERQEAADLAAVAAEIAIRNACANAGRIYLPTHASADAGGCVNPAIWSEAWSVGAWGGCSVTCGGGSQSRPVQCFDGLGTPQPDAACPAPKPATTQACNTQACAAPVTCTIARPFGGQTTYSAGAFISCSFPAGTPAGQQVCKSGATIDTTHVTQDRTFTPTPTGAAPKWSFITANSGVNIYKCQ